MNNINPMKTSSSAMSGFLDPPALSFYPLVMDQIDDITNEFMHDSLDLSFLKIRVGYEKTWHQTITDVDDLSPPIENWIKEGGFHQQQIGYDSRDGKWQTFPLFKADEPELSETISAFLPKTIALLRVIPGLHFAAFFKQPPMAAVKPHAHTLNHAICHFLLTDLERGRAWIQVNGRKQYLKNKGDCIAFNYMHTHSSCNESESDRINLVLDVVL